MRICRVVFLACVLLSRATDAKAAVIDIADVTINGTVYRAFQDQTTGFVWLDLDNFFAGTNTYNSIVTALAGSSFHIATTTELAGLQASIPATPGLFNSQVTIIGGNYTGNPYSTQDRPLIWGIYDDGNTAAISYSFHFSVDGVWTNGPNQLLPTSAFSTVASPNNDLGAFVVSTTAVPVPVPEPASMTLLGVGLAGLWSRNWRRRRKS